MSARERVHHKNVDDRGCISVLQTEYDKTDSDTALIKNIIVLWLDAHMPNQKPLYTERKLILIQIFFLVFSKK